MLQSRPFRSRTDQAHVTSESIDQLLQCIKVQTSKPKNYPSNAQITRDCPNRLRVLRRNRHRQHLWTLKQLPSKPLRCWQQNTEPLSSNQTKNIAKKQNQNQWGIHRGEAGYKLLTKVPDRILPRTHE